jgi:protein O-mannosyl-transferase
MSELRRTKQAKRVAVEARGPAHAPSQRPAPPSRQRIAVICLILIALILIVYGPVRHYGFVSIDDGSYVTVNPDVNTGLTWHGVVWALTSGYAANWHPLTWWSHMLDVQLYGLNAGPHHVTNVLLHIASTLLLFGALYVMTRALYRSAFVAALFAVHPQHVESVAWVAERKDVLSTFFGMLAIYAYAGYIRKGGRVRYALVAVAFGLGLMAKPMLVTLPFVLLLLDYWPLNRITLGDWPRQVQLVREKIPLFILAALSSVVTFWAQRTAGAVAGLTGFPLDLRIANALVSWAGYIRKMVWPVNLPAFYPYPRSLPSGELALSLLILIGISLWVLAGIKRRPYALVGWLWYLGTLIPVIGLVQVGEQAMADRYSYIPLVGLFIIVAWGGTDLVRAHSRQADFILAVAAVLLIFGCTILARTQVGYWENSVKLWEHTLAITTDNYRTHADLAGVLAADAKYDDAVAHYSEALRIRPNVSGTHNNLGITLALAGKPENAIREFSEALRLRPDFTEAQNNLGNALLTQGKFGEAKAIFTAVLSSNPDNAQARSNWASALVKEGKIDEGIAQYSETLRRNPDYVDAHTQLALVLAKQRRFDEAITHFRKALQFLPEDAQLHNNLGVALASQGKISDAVREFSAALRAKPDFADARNNLARAQQDQQRPY